jgi:hypothetical protein
MASEATANREVGALLIARPRHLGRRSARKGPFGRLFISDPARKSGQNTRTRMGEPLLRAIQFGQFGDAQLIDGSYAGAEPCR